MVNYWYYTYHIHRFTCIFMVYKFIVASSLIDTITIY